MVARKLLGEALRLVGGYGLALALGLVGSIILTRALGEVARGELAWLLTLQGLAMQAAALISYPAARQLAAATPTAQWPQMLGSFSAFGLMGTLLAVPFLAYGLLVSPVGQAYPGMLLALFLIVPFFNMAQVWMGVLLTNPSWTVALAQGSSQKAMVLVGVLLLMAMGSVNLGSTVALQVITSLLYLGLMYALLGIPARSWKIEPARWQAAIPFVGASWAAIGLLFALPKLVILQLGNTGQLAETAHYAVAAGLFEAALAIPTLASSVLITHFTRSGGGVAARRKVTWVVLLGMGGVGALAALVAPLMIPLLFGAPFVASVAPFQILMICLVLAAVHQAWFSRLTAATAKVALVVPPLLGCVVVGAGCLYYQNALQAEGAAWLTALGYGVMLLATYALKKDH